MPLCTCCLCATDVSASLFSRCRSSRGSPSYHRSQRGDRAAALSGNKFVSVYVFSTAFINMGTLVDLKLLGIQ